MPIFLYKKSTRQRGLAYRIYSNPAGFRPPSLTSAFVNKAILLCAPLICKIHTACI